MGVNGYSSRSGAALSAPDLRNIRVEQANENDFVRITVDLTVSRNNQPLGIAGTSLYIADLGGADWQIRLGSSTASLLYSTDFAARTTIQGRFTELYFTNAAAAAGTAPVVFIVGRYV